MVVCRKRRWLICGAATLMDYLPGKALRSKSYLFIAEFDSLHVSKHAQGSQSAHQRQRLAPSNACWPIHSVIAIRKESRCTYALLYLTCLLALNVRR